MNYAGICEVGRRGAAIGNFIFNNKLDTLLI
jgi:hypothetical protein